MSKSTNVTLPDELWEQCKIFAIKNRISFAELIRQALLEKIKEKEKE